MLKLIFVIYLRFLIIFQNMHQLAGNKKKVSVMALFKDHTDKHVWR